MPIYISGISTELFQGDDQAIAQAVSRLGVPKGKIKAAYVVKQSLDARKRERIHFVSTVGIELEEGESEAAKAASDPCVSYKPVFQLQVAPGRERLSGRIVIAGFGPAGIFAALLLARQGYRPLVLERGSRMEKRVDAVERFWAGEGLNPRCNVQFGEGGAGTFSDGKLTTRISDPRCSYVLDAFAAHGAPQEILRKAKPHIGTDRLRDVVRSIREEICSLGGEILFDTALEDLILDGGNVTGVRTSNGEFPVAALVLAVGHSARDTFSMLAGRGVELCAKPFSVGARIEQRQEVINRGLYGRYADHPRLPQGEYQLSHRDRSGRGVYTFCMCPGGLVVPSSSEEGGVVTNGMSEFARDRENANAALVVSVGPEDFGSHPLDGVRFQQKLERSAFAAGGGNYQAPGTTVDCFLAGHAGLNLGKVTPSYALGVCLADFERILPPPVISMMRDGLRLFQRKLPGFGAADGVLTGVETRTSSPVRIPREDESRMARGIGNLYPCGEGAGYAGGIMSAAVDGLKTAEAVISRFCPD